MLQSESRRLYSWWWDSHISPKNSKWLQENLTDMDAKVKAMIKLIEEDADSFARRAEMYYKKRPELIKLVEEFYRAYRALAERYNHATRELRHAHQTMAEAFPTQVPFVLADDSPSGSSAPEVEPHTPEMSHPIRAWLDPVDLCKDELSLSSESGSRKKALKQLKEMFDSSEKEQSLPNGNSEVLALKKALAGIEAEKEEVLLQYQQSSEKLSNLEGELNCAQEDARKLDGQAKKAEIEIQALKEALSKSEAERDAALLQHRLCLERISKLEIMLSLGQQQSIKAEGESQNLKHKLSRLETEKETGLVQYKQCLEKISVLENKISVAEKNARKLIERAEKAETEVELLKQALCKASEEKEYVNLQHVKCLETILKLESDTSRAQEDAKRLANEILIGVTKLESAEEQCALLERLNQSLRLEAENLARKIAIKDQELSEKHEELKKVQVRAQDEQSRFVHIEATLQTIQNLHSQSQEEQRAMASELRDGFQMLKDLEIRRHGLEEEVRQVKEENQGLSELNLASEASIKNLQNEIFGLKEMKRKLEEEIERRVDQSNAVQEEIFHLKEEIKGLNVRYWALIEQVESVGLNPESLGSSVKDLRDENSNLKEMCKKNQDEKEAMLKKLENMEKFSETNAALEGWVSELQGEKSALVAGKDSLFSQLQQITVNLEEILEKNTLLENSLSGANAELEGLKIKSTSLEESCKFLDDEKSNLLDERGTLVSQLENVERRLEDLEKRFIALEEKYAGMEKEKESTLSQVGELQTSLVLEKQEHASFAVSSEARLADLENHVRLLQEESKWKKKEFEEDLDRAMNSQFEIFILQKLLRDMEDGNFSLLIECESHIEAAKFSEKFILELQRENLEKQVEIEFLFDEIQMMRRGINQVFKVLEADSDHSCGDEIEKEEFPISCILRSIEEMKCSKQRILVENSVLLTLLEQMRLEKIELESGKETLDQDLRIVTKNLEMLQNEKHELLEVNEKLKLEVSKGHQREEILEAEIDSISTKHADLQGAYLVLQGENSKLLEGNGSLLKELSNLKEEKCTLERENSVILQEAASFSNLASIFMSYGSEKAAELSSFHEANNELKSDVEKLGKEFREVKGSNDLLNHQVLIANKFINEKETKLSEAEQKFKAKEIMVEELKREREESKLTIHELSDCNIDQKMEIECLREVNGELESKLEEYRIREENLTLELQERSNVSELWEAEAAGFYFDLQISNISEIVFKSKVHELSGVCESLSNESASKSIEMEQMKERVSFLESENEGLKAHLSSYVPVIESLGNSVASLEHNAHFRTQSVAEYQGEKVSDFSFHLHEKIRKELGVDRIQEVPDGISDLQKLQTRVEAVVEERERLAVTKSSTAIIKLEAAKKSKDVLNQRKYIHKEEKKLGEITELRIGVHMKDIPLDQVSNGSFNGLSKRMINRGRNDQILELWKSPEKDNVVKFRVEDEAPKSEKELSVDKLEVSPSIKERTNEGKRRKILERLTSDAQKLRALQVTVQDLRSKVETIKKSNKRAKSAEQETVKGQLQEAEEAITQLVGMNGELVNTIEVGTSSFNEKVLVDSEEAGNLQRKRVSEQARKGSEKIGRLQLEVEKIQYLLLKLEIPKKSRFRISESRTSVLLRNFVYNGGRSNNGRQQKKGLCGCFRPSGSNGVSHNY